MMKLLYSSPSITVEELEKIDVLCDSEVEEHDNASISGGTGGYIDPGTGDDDW